MSSQACVGTQHVLKSTTSQGATSKAGDSLVRALIASGTMYTSGVMPMSVVKIATFNAKLGRRGGVPV